MRCLALFWLVPLLALGDRASTDVPSILAGLDRALVAQVEDGAKAYLEARAASRIGLVLLEVVRVHGSVLLEL